MNEEALEREMDANRKAWEQLRDQVRRDYPGKFVALAFGRLIGTAETYGEAVALVQRLDPAPCSFEVFLSGEEPLFETILDLRGEYL